MPPNTGWRWLVLSLVSEEPEWWCTALVHIYACDTRLVTIHVPDRAFTPRVFPPQPIQANDPGKRVKETTWPMACVPVNVRSLCGCPAMLPPHMHGRGSTDCERDWFWWVSWAFFGTCDNSHGASANCFHRCRTVRRCCRIRARTYTCTWRLRRVSLHGSSVLEPCGVRLHCTAFGSGGTCYHGTPPIPIPDLLLCRVLNRTMLLSQPDPSSPLATPRVPNTNANRQVSPHGTSQTHTHTQPVAVS